MVGSAHQGRDSIEKLVQEEELSDLSDFEYMEGFGDREVLYKEGSTDAWFGADYTIDMSDKR